MSKIGNAFINLGKALQEDWRSIKNIPNLTREQKIAGLKDYGLITVGALLMAVGFMIFIAPLHWTPGGVVGIAIIMNYLFGVKIGTMEICLNIPLLIIGALWLGGKFGIKTIWGILTLGWFCNLIAWFYGTPDGPAINLFTYVFGFNNPTQYICAPLMPESANVLAALCGAVLLGVGLALIFKTKATTGGTDLITMIIGKYVKHIPLGTILIFVDSTIVLCALATFGEWQIPIYSWLIIYVTGIVIDKVTASFYAGKSVMIVSKNFTEIFDRCLEELNRRGTVLNGLDIRKIDASEVPENAQIQEVNNITSTSGLGIDDNNIPIRRFVKDRSGVIRKNVEKNMIVISVSTRELAPLLKIVKESDPHAFVS
ncbi:MAG: YitT family protein, partial [Bacteroidales bacterium]|nr:YitT family protein [Bacteroidales bacterium]